MRRLFVAIFISILLAACGAPTPSPEDGTATAHAVRYATDDAIGTNYAVSSPSATTTRPTRTPHPPTGELTAPELPTVSLPFITDGGALPEGALVRIGIGYILTHAVSPDGAQIAVGASTGIYVYQLPGFTRLWRRYTTYPVGFVAWSPDGSKLTTGEDSSFNNFAEPALWDAATGTKIADLKGAWYGATWSPDSTLIATVSYPGEGPSQLMIFDSTGRLVQASPIEGTDFLSSAVWLPDGGTIAIADTRDLWVVVPDILLWDVKANRLRGQIANTSSWWPKGIYASPEGRYVTLGIAPGSDGLPIWAANTAQQAFTLPIDAGPLRDLAWSHSGSEIASLTDDRLIISSVPLGETLRELPVTGRTLAWSPDDLHFAVSTYDQVSVVNIINGGSEAGLSLPTVESRFFGDYPVFHWLPDASGLSVSTRERLFTWDHNTGETSGFNTYGDLLQIRWLPGGESLAVRRSDGSFDLWDINTGQPVDSSADPDVAALFDVTASDTSPDGRLKLDLDQSDGVGDGPIGGGMYYETSTLTITDTSASAQLLQLEFTGLGITSFAWSPDSGRLALGFGSGTLRGAQTSEIVIINPRTGEVLETLSAHTGDVTGLAFSPDGKLLASTSLDCSVIVWILTS